MWHISEQFLVDVEPYTSSVFVLDGSQPIMTTCMLLGELSIIAVIFVVGVWKGCLSAVGSSAFCEKSSTSIIPCISTFGIQI